MSSNDTQRQICSSTKVFLRGDEWEINAATERRSQEPGGGTSHASGEGESKGHGVAVTAVTKGPKP